MVELYYIVQRGETTESIAKRLHFTEDEILFAADAAGQRYEESQKCALNRNCFETLIDCLFGNKQRSARQGIGEYNDHRGSTSLFIVPGTKLVFNM